MRSALNILWLGIKEIRSLVSDRVMVLFVIYAFTLAIYSQATGTSNEVNNASIAFADEDGSALSQELFNAFYPPRFQFAQPIRTSEVEDVMDEGRFMFVVTIPPQFERNLRAGRQPDIQVSIDATAMQQAGIGSGYIKNIIDDRIASFLSRTDVTPPKSVNLVVRKLFNPNGIGMVHQHRGDHQPADAAHRGPHRSRGHSRARTRDARAPLGHAAHCLRDRHGQGVGQ